MPHNFMPGDTAILVNARDDYACYRGKPVKILTPLRKADTRYGPMMVHEVEPTNRRPEHDGVLIVPPQLLRPLCRPGPNEPGDWDVIWFCANWDPRDA